MGKMAAFGLIMFKMVSHVYSNVLCFKYNLISLVNLVNRSSVKHKTAESFFSQGLRAWVLIKENFGCFLYSKSSHCIPKLFIETLLWS